MAEYGLLVGQFLIASSKFAPAVSELPEQSSPDGISQQQCNASPGS